MFFIIIIIYAMILILGTGIAIKAVKYVPMQVFDNIVCTTREQMRVILCIKTFSSTLHHYW